MSFTSPSIFLYLIIIQAIPLSWYQVKGITLCCFCQMHDREYEKMSVILVLSLGLWGSSVSEETSCFLRSYVFGKLRAQYSLVQWKMKLPFILPKPLLKEYCAWHDFTSSGNPLYLYSCPGTWCQISGTRRPWVAQDYAVSLGQLRGSPFGPCAPYPPSPVQLNQQLKA